MTNIEFKILLLNLAWTRALLADMFTERLIVPTCLPLANEWRPNLCRVPPYNNIWTNGVSGYYRMGISTDTSRSSTSCEASLSILELWPKWGFGFPENGLYL